MKLVLERISPDSGSSFRLLLTPNLNHIFYWHFHPEIELAYVEAPKGIRHIGEHISTYEESDLVLIGSNIPHLNFDYGVKEKVETVVVQVQEDFVHAAWQQIPELEAIVALFERAKTGIAFYGETKKKVGLRLKSLQQLDKFSQYLELMQLFQIMAISTEFTLLFVRPITNQQLLKQQSRMHQIYHFVETHFKDRINIDQVAQLVHLSVPAFCRYFKKTTQLTYTDFVNQYRVTVAKKMLLQNKSIAEAGFEAGFENLSYFTRTFKKVTGQTPSQYKTSTANP